MAILGKIIAILAIMALSWFLYRYVKENPGQTLSKENASKSLGILGVLALLLIALVGFAVMALRAA